MFFTFEILSRAMNHSKKLPKLGQTSFSRQDRPLSAYFYLIRGRIQFDCFDRLVIPKISVHCAVKHGLSFEKYSKFAKSQEVSNVRALQISNEGSFIHINSGKIFERDLLSSDSVAKSTTQKPWVFVRLLCLFLPVISEQCCSHR